MSVADEYRAKLGLTSQPAQTAPSTGSVADKYRSRLPDLDARPAEQAETPDNSNWVDRVNAAGQGASFGFADEAGSAIAATAASMFGDTDESWGDIYSSMMESEQGKREHFAEKNPAENLALQVGGGFLTGGAGLVKAVPKLAAKMGGGRLATTAATALVGAAEGGAAGFGSTDGDFGDRMEGAGVGATVGAVLPLAVSGVGAGVRSVAKRRVAQDLVGEGGKFTPITVADKEGALGSFYRDVVAPAFGSGKLKDQVKPFAEAAERKVTALTKAVGRVATGGKAKIARAKQAIVNQSDDQVNKIDQNFRAQALDASTPAQMPPASRSLLDPENPQASMNQLEQFWQKNGFQSAKGKTFDLDVNDFERSFKGMFDDDPVLKRAAGDFLPDIMSDFNRVFTRPPKPRIRTGVTSIASPQPTRGTMTGNNLMELRNKYARMANSAENGLQRTAFRKISDRVDKMVRDGLDPESLAQYNDDISRWESFSTLGKATGSAANKKGGMFTPDEWLTATKNHKLKSGKGVLQDTAQSGQAQKIGLDKAKKQQIIDNPVKQQMKDAGVKLKGRLKDAEVNAKDMKALTGTPTNLFRTLAATSVLGAPTAAVTRQLGDTLFGGVGMGKLLSSKTAQKVLAGQTGAQKALAKTLRGYDKSKYNPLLRGGPSAAVAGREEEIEELIYGRK